MGNHTTRPFDADLAALASKVLEMGRLVERQVTDAVTALERDDAALAEAVITRDDVVDALQREIEAKAIAAIARWQPMAIDLREIVGALRASYDLERIGDLAESIARRSTALTGLPRVNRALQHFLGMAHVVQRQLTAVIDSYRRRDVAAALDISRRDKGVDTLGNALFRELLCDMTESPQDITFCTHVLFCAKILERIGDHVVNVAEAIYFIVRGKSPSYERRNSTTLPKGALQPPASPAPGVSAARLEGHVA